jgi:ABC-type branched-subunit amino acid transport system substrate-binding protein
MARKPHRRVAVFLLLSLVLATAAGTETNEPYRDLTRHTAEYAGPGRDDAEAATPEEIRIGYFGPSDPGHPGGGDVWLAASLAVEDANRAGGFRGIPYRLVPAWSENPWGTGVARVARLVYDDRVWAIVGSIDGATTHLAEQVVAKARVTLLSPVAVDGTVNLANVAWTFSCLPQHGPQTDRLGRAIADSIGNGSLTLLSATDHDSRVFARALERFLVARGLAPRHHLEFEPGVEQCTALVERVIASKPDAVAILAGPRDSARIAASLREHDARVEVFGGPAMGRRSFLERAGPAAEGVQFPLLCDPEALSGEFASRFASRFGRSPDCAAVQAYDAVHLLAAAVERAGLNRARIRDAVRELSPWSGVAGSIDWNPVGQNRRAVRLARIADGRIVALP